jgi:hypothetical protein
VSLDRLPKFNLQLDGKVCVDQIYYKMKAVLSGDFIVKLDTPNRHEKFGSFAISFIEIDSIKLYSKTYLDNGNTFFSSDCGYSNTADPDENGCIEVYFEDYEAIFECYDYTYDDYARASTACKVNVSEVRVGICFFMYDEELNTNYVSEQFSFAPSEISFDCSASANEMIDAINAKHELKRLLMQCNTYEDVQNCFKEYGLAACDSESFASVLGLGDQSNEEVARYGWGSCIVSFATCGVFEGIDH